MAETNTQISTLPPVVERRLMQLSYTMDEHKVEAIVVTYMPNIRYMTNFSGSAATLFLTKDKAVFVTDDRYAEQIKTELYPLPNLEIYITRDVWATLNEEKFLGSAKSIAFEADRIPYSDAVEVRNRIRPLKFKPAVDLVEKFTQPKAIIEQENLKKACELAETTFEKIISDLKPGMTEKEISREILYQSRVLGSEGDPFEPRVVSGERTAIVHGKPSDRKIQKDEIIYIDFGCMVNGFVSNICRPFVLGKASDELKSIYTTIKKAQHAAIKGVVPGMNGKTMDGFARQIIQDEGYGENFQHSLGHGIGLVYIESPIITFRMEDQIIPENSILTVEPGIYIPDKFGMRVCDEIFVKKSGGELLTNSPTELLEI